MSLPIIKKQLEYSDKKTFILITVSKILVTVVLMMALIDKKPIVKINELFCRNFASEIKSPSQQ